MMYSLQKWFNSLDICFSTPREANWRDKLDGILCNPENFFKNGGWSYSKSVDSKGQLPTEWMVDSWLFDDVSDRADEEYGYEGT